MLIKYEFNTQKDGDEYLHEVFLKAEDMYKALCELQRYARGLNKGWVQDDAQTIVEHIFDCIFDSKINDIE